MSETRYLLEHELRLVGEAGKPNRLTGYAAVYNSLSEDLGGFRERIIPGAFKKTIADGHDVLALVGHEAEQILARQSNQTLKVTEDDRGLAVDIAIPDTSYGKDAVENVKVGNIKAMSFAFIAKADRWLVENGENIRELLDVVLDEVSIVVRPAYPQTSVVVRSNNPDVQKALIRAEKNLELSEADQKAIKDEIAKLEAKLPRFNIDHSKWVRQRESEC